MPLTMTVSDSESLSLVEFHRRKQTLDFDENLDMILSRKRMTLLFKIIMQWRCIAKKHI
jgi:hypothetical protein